MDTANNRPLSDPDAPNNPPPQTGNASNPTPYDKSTEPAPNQLLDEKAEKYLRESASPEDYPDPQDELEAEKE